MNTFSTSDTTVHVCLHGHSGNGQTTVAAMGTISNPLVVDVLAWPTIPLELSKIDSLALAISALADVSAIATSATELTAVEKNQLRAIFAARIRLLMT